MNVTFTLVTKDNGPLTKIIRSDGNGGIEKDSSQCYLTSGVCETVTTEFSRFGAGLRRLKPQQAIVHGVSGRRGKVRIVSEKKMEGGTDAITRTKDVFAYHPTDALGFLDHDPKLGQTALTVDEFIDAVSEVFPAFRDAAKVHTPSTSAFIYHGDKELRGEGSGFHLYVVVADSSDIERFKTVLFKRLWLAGHGYIFITKDGKQLERTIFDTAVFSPERLDFVAGAVCEDGLEQRLPDPVYIDGTHLDTRALPDVTDEEERQYVDLVKEAKNATRAEADTAREKYLSEHTERLARERKIHVNEARKILEARLSGGALHLDDELHFDHLGTVTVRDVLADLGKYDKEPLADPVEPEYGRGRATFYANSPSGVPAVNSHAHGGRVFTLPRLPEPPHPLRRNLPRPEPFPIGVLSPVLSALATKIGAITKSPAAIQGQSLLAAAALTAQAHVDIEIDGRRSPTSEFFVSVAATGERKSAVDEIVLSPHRKMEAKLRGEREAELRDYADKHAAWKKAKEEAIGQNAKGRLAKELALAEVGAEPPPPLGAQILTDEPTYEGLVISLHQGQPSIGLFSDEGGRFLGGHAMNTENALKTVSGLSHLWDGKAITRTRAADGAITLPGRRVSLHLMVQPIVSTRLFADSVLLGQGFLSRCLVSYPDSTVGTREYTEENLRESPEFKAYFNKIMNRLELPLPLAPGSRNELETQPLKVDGAAKRLWIAFQNHVERLQREGEALFPIRGFASKAAEHAARIAGAFSFLDDPEARSLSGKVDMERGIELAQYYLNEALRLFHSSTEDQELIEAERALVWAQAQPGRVFSLVDLYQRGPNALRSKAQAKKVIHTLEGHGWIERLQGGGTVGGQHRRDVWQVVG